MMIWYFVQGWVRFDGENKAVEGLQAAKDANDGKVVIMENELTGRILEGLYPCLLS